MRIPAIVGACTLIGLALGIGGAVLQRGWPVDGDPFAPVIATVGENAQPPLPSDGPQPKVVLPEPVFDFGEMPTDSKGRHKFVIRNEGEFRLTLTEAGTSCACTLSELERRELLPGEETTATVEWTTEGRMGPFRHTASFRTNSLARQFFAVTIKGDVLPGLMARPSNLALGSLVADETKTVRFHVFAYHADDLLIARYQLLDATTADFFDVRHRTLAAEETAKEGAKSGIEFNVTIKPGLPRGPFKQTIRLDTSLDADRPLEVVLSGAVVAALRIVGRGWDESRGLLQIGKAPPEGETRKLNLLVRGPHHDSVTIKLVRATPELMRVTIGRPASSKSLTRIPLEIRVMPGENAENYLGSREEGYGEIVLATSHPDFPELKIAVSVATEGRPRKSSNSDAREDGDAR